MYAGLCPANVNLLTPPITPLSLGVCVWFAYHNVDVTECIMRAPMISRVTLLTNAFM